MSNRYRRVLSLEVRGWLRAILWPPFVAAMLTAAVSWHPQPALAQYRQDTEKLYGTDYLQTSTPREAGSVAISGDGSTILWSGTDSAWMLTRGSTGPNGWDPLNIKAFPKGSEGGAGPVALSTDGNTAVVGGGFGGNQAFTTVFTRSGGAWSQLVAVPTNGGTLGLSGDGGTFIQGSFSANAGAGAVWVYSNSSGTWGQQAQLAVSDAIGLAGIGYSVALSSDGNTAIVGGLNDNNRIGAAWVFTRSGGVWTQQAKLVGSGMTGTLAEQGSAVALSADGNTALVGGMLDNNEMGAVWVFTRSGGQWTQQGSKLVGTGASGTTAGQGWAVSLSANGNIVFVGGPGDSSVGAVWVFGRTGGVWTQMGDKLVPNDVSSDNVNAGTVGWSVALSADGRTAVFGDPGDDANRGSAWVYTGPRYDGFFTSTHDLNNDHGSDIIWRRNDGAMVAWLIGSGQILQQGGFGQIPTNWQLVGQRDFNGDGFCDLLWRDSNTGTVVIWLMNGLSVQQMGTIGAVPNNWVIVGTADFNGDGNGDILWRDSNTGTVAVWLMNGFSVLQSVGLGAVPSNWVIAATDRAGSIFWRDTNTGELDVWWAFNQGVLQSASLGVVPLNWVIAGIGDFDANGETDILWRDTKTGAVAIWLMDAYKVMASWGLGAVPPNWSIVETGDFAGGYSDILWRDSNTGAVVIWVLNGTVQQVQSVGLAAVPLEWSVQSLNAE